METTLYLTIRREGKTIPYAPQDRTDSRNHGYLHLKGRQHCIEQIPEARDHPVLQDVLLRLNADRTGFLTLGCDYSLNTASGEASSTGGRRYWAKGYVDVGFVDQERVRNIQEYFLLFVRFDTYLQSRSFTGPVDFHWELDRTRFQETDCSGWTVCLWITTDWFGTGQDAQACWALAMEAFCSFLEQV